MRGLLVLAIATTLLACTDTDQDGTRDAKDCVPSDPAIHPDAKEICNGIDDNCNGQVDEDVAIVAYWDRDRDGFGDAAFARRVCTLPEDGSEVAGDCDDRDPTTNPDAVELCDQLDNDCNGEVDDNVVPLTFYGDADGDGAGDPAVTVEDCIAPEGFVGNSNDCDDGDPSRWAGASEVCDGLDNDCDGEVDEGLEDVLVYADNDGDGSGDPSITGLECGALPGWSLDDRDCDDTDPALGGSSDEVQGNGIDEDCDGYIDEYGVPTPYATFEDAVINIGLGSGTEVVQFDDGLHALNLDAAGYNVIIAGEGCGRTVLYGAGPQPVVQMTDGRIEGLTITGGTGNRGGGLRVERDGEVWAVGVCIEGNSADDRGGGAAVVDTGTLHLWDSRVAGNTAEVMGGGVYVHAGGTVDIQRTLVQGNEARLQYGGGIGVRGGHAEITNTVVAGNHAFAFGGGIYIANEAVAPVATGDPTTTSRGSANIAYVTVHGNTLDPVDGLLGSGLLVGGSVVDIRHSSFSGHPVGFDAIATKDANVTGTQWFNPTFSSQDMHFGGNQGYELNIFGDYPNLSGPAVGPENDLHSWYLQAAGRGDQRFANVDPSFDPTLWDLRTTSGSSLVDAAQDETVQVENPPGTFYDITVPQLDPDGSPADIGAWGGPLAEDPGFLSGETPLWRPWPLRGSLTAEDLDSDGLYDYWELRYGTDPIRDDASDDPDGDGLGNLEEQIAGTDPRDPDTDHDGVDDLTESNDGTNPLLPAENRPLAWIDHDQFALVGTPVTLSGAASGDPNGDSLQFTWSITNAPFGSAAAIVDPTLPEATFTPDQPGLYEIELVVGDGQGTSEPVGRWVDARTGVIVPDQAATLQDALAMTYDDQGIFVRAGTWGPIDLTGRAVAIVGLDEPSSVILDGGGQASVVMADSGRIALASLTITNGSADAGGGIHLNDASELVLRNVRIHGNVAGSGGAIHALDTPLDIADSEIYENLAGEGGGIWADGGALILSRSRLHTNNAMNGGALWLDAAGSILENVEIQSNQATQGAALWVGDTAVVEMNNCASVSNRGESVVFNDTGFLYSLGVVWHEPGALTSPNVVLDGNNPAFWRPMKNHDGMSLLPNRFWYASNIAAALEPIAVGDPMFVSFIDDGDATNDLLLPREGSPLIDAGWQDFTDRDGSPADVGLGAGAIATPLGVQGKWDTDGDGLDDAWEHLFGLDPHDPQDVTTDADGDGWNALDEYVSGTSPSSSDSDGDGVSDPDELLAGSDPTAPDSGRPVAVAEAGPEQREGDIHQVFGNGSYDPDGQPGPLTYQWRLVVVPEGSTFDITGLSDPTSPDPTFVPDVAGRYVLGLTVNDGASDSFEALVEVRPHRLLRVPSQYATIEDAHAIAESGDVVYLEPGVHDLRVEEFVEGVAIEGAGFDQTFVHGLAGLAVFFIEGADVVDADPPVVVRDLTIAGANGNDGGAIECRYSGSLTLERVVLEFNAASYGGAIRAQDCDLDFTDVDLLDNQASGSGGGMTMYGGTLTWTRGVVARNSAVATGGGLYFWNTDAYIENVILHHNHSDSGGGAVFQSIDTTDVDGDGMVDNEPMQLRMHHVTVAGNDGRDGALYLNYAEIRNAIVQQNNNHGVFESTSLYEANIAIQRTGLYGNDDGPTFGDDIVETATTLEDARFVFLDPYDGAGYTSDFRLPLYSPLIDMGSVASPSDPDGSTADPGAYGGPNTWSDWNAWQLDSDSDGMSDLWEAANGLNVGTDDSANDADLDGRSNAWEHDNFTNPQSNDTDGDGWADGTEDLDPDSDPTDPSDHRPVANPGADVTGASVGMPRSLNGILSSDPDNDPITSYSWSLVEKPGRSTLTTSDITNADAALMTFTPDTPGTFTFALVVSASATFSEPGLVNVAVEGTVLVPEDYASVAEAVAGVADGSMIDIAAGTWPTEVDVAGKDITFSGAGADQTILDGEGRGSVIFGDNSEHLVVQDLTVTGGLAAEGGGIHLEGSLSMLELIDATVAANDGIYGGGIYIRNGTLLATRARIVDNTSGRNAGGLYATGSTVDLFHSLLAGNISVDLHGGAINLFNGDLTVTNSVLADNWTDQEGGAIYANGADAEYPPGSGTIIATTTVVLDQVHLVGNTALDEGSALKFAKADVQLQNTLITHNRGNGGAVVAQGTINAFESQYSLADDNDVQAFDLSENPALILFLPFDGDANGNLVGRSPDLIGWTENGDWTDDDWSLGPTSNALDAGDPGVSDPDGSPSDIGAFGGPDGAWTP